MKYFKNKLVISILYLTLGWVNLYKLTLMHQGFFTEPDERRYLNTWYFLKHLLQGDWPGAIHPIFSAQGRPASILLHTIPAGLQFLSAKIRHLELFESRNFDVVFGYNFFIYLLILIVLYRLFQLIFQDKILSLTGLLFYSVLVNNFIYLRHIYPYNESLLIFIFLVYRLIKNYQSEQVFSVKFAYLIGLVAFFGFAVYPAYYLSFIAVYLLFNLLLKHTHIALHRLLLLNMSYIVGSLSMLTLFEILAHFGQASYIYNLLHLSGTVNQGSYEEAFSFIFKYFWQVEQITGLWLIISLVIFVIYYRRVRQKNKQLTGDMVLSFLIPFLIYTGSSYFLHKMVMMGRILHQFIFIIILISLFDIGIVQEKFRKYLIILLTFLFSLQFYFQIQTYLKFSYPRDVYWQYLKTYPFSQIEEISEYEDSWSNLPQKIDSIYINKNQRDTITIVNGQYFYPVETPVKYHPYYPKTSKKQILNRLHFINYKAYQYEGYGIKARKLIDSLQFRIKIYR